MDLFDGHTGDNSLFLEQHEVRNPIENIMTWMADHPDAFQEIDFVCSSEIFRRIFDMAFERDVRHILVTKYDDKIFARIFDKGDRKPLLAKDPRASIWRWQTDVSSYAMPLVDTNPTIDVNSYLGNNYTQFGSASTSVQVDRNVSNGRQLFREKYLTPDSDSNWRTKHQPVVVPQRHYNPRIDHTIYAFHKFKDLVTKKINADDHDKKYYNVIKATFGDHSLLYAVEVECIKNDFDGDLKFENVTALKTCGDRTHRDTPGKTPYHKQYLSRKWWTKSVMTGIKDMFVGFKDQDKEYDPKIVQCKRTWTFTLDEMARDAQGWSTADAFRMLNEFLLAAKRIVTENDRNTVYMFEIDGIEREIRYKRYRTGQWKIFPVVSDEMAEKLDQLNK